MTAAGELNQVDELPEEEETGDSEVYDENRLLAELEALGSAALISEDLTGTELLDNDNDETKRLYDKWTIFDGIKPNSTRNNERANGMIRRTVDFLLDPTSPMTGVFRSALKRMTNEE